DSVLPARAVKLSRSSIGSSQPVTPSTCIFFFQAEDGIRDLTVTGVQTCALPIYQGHVHRPMFAHELQHAADQGVPSGIAQVAQRSEERRVGKECRCGWDVDD